MRSTRRRWDAVALCELLVPFHSYLVRYSAERCVGRAPGCTASALVALDVVDAWQEEHDVDAAVRVGRSSLARR